MSLTGTTNEQKIWNYLLPIINNPMGVAAVIGAGTYPESGNISTNLQQTYENNPSKTFGKSFNDTTYTSAVDNGTYTRDNFTSDKAGYGLCQWTYWSRKQALYDHCKSKGVSIGDLEAQLEYLVKELKQYGLLTKLQAVTDLRTASNIILLEFEKPASKDTKETQDRRFGYTQDVYNRLAAKTSTTPQKGGNTVGYTNSSLATYKLLSPNHSGQRNHIIDRITPHCFVGQVTAKRGAEVFQPTAKKASCQYVIGKDGDISLVCEEKNRSWCTSSSANDHRAITIEVASDSKHPYTITAAAYEALIKLCADICRRNGKKRVTWLADKDKSINYAPASDEMIFTVHKWFAAKACPGDYIYNHLTDITARVNALLGSASVVPTITNKPGSTPAPTQTTPTQRVNATKAAQEKDTSLSGAYLVTSDDGLNVRNGAGTKINKVLVSLPKNTKVMCYGYYTKAADGAKWLYIQTTYNGVTYTGFCHSAYLKKV